jgi:hypothetical protein
MRTIAVALALGMLLALCTADRPASAQEGTAANSRLLPPRRSCGSSWVPDYFIVPRYCYNPRDDRVDTGPTAKPVAPALNDYCGTGGSGW